MYGQLIFCVGGIYVFFLTWGILQERISTLAYVDASGNKERFTYFLFMNMTQSLIAAISALVISQFASVRIGNINWPIFKQYVIAAVSHSMASPLGYASLKHINFPTMIIGKSCKLVPVMLMNILIYRKRFPLSKYFTVFLVTVGVAGFMYFEEKHEQAAHHTSSPTSSTNSFIGIALLLGNLLLDGATNSIQDKIFIQYRVHSLHMMFYMNIVATGLLLGWMLLNPFTNEFQHALLFIEKYPSSLWDILAFAFCGAMGQNFIYYTLEKFGSLSLVMVTVTRKMFTILISLFYFSHPMNVIQWASVLLVFCALIFEASTKKEDHGDTLPTKNAKNVKSN